jgi:hypothetical protein
VAPLIIEKDINFQFLESPECHQKIHAVASEAADGLGICVSSSMYTIKNHLNSNS